MNSMSFNIYLKSSRLHSVIRHENINALQDTGKASFAGCTPSIFKMCSILQLLEIEHEI